MTEGLVRSLLVSLSVLTLLAAINACSETLVSPTVSATPNLDTTLPSTQTPLPTTIHVPTLSPTVTIASPLPTPLPTSTSVPLPTPPPTPLPTTEIGEPGELPAGDAEQASRQAEIWQPAPGTTWQWQLSGERIDQSFDVDMYDIDLFENDAELVATLGQGGRRVICYLSAGSWEEWRPDARQFPASVIGKDYEGWSGEKWLDIRQIELLAPIMRSRLDQCAAKGYDGIEPDNIDGYQADTGFSLTYDDQLRYNIWLANEAHARGLSIGLKNVPEQVDDLLAHFDWALTEDCFYQGWCGELLPFINAGRPSSPPNIPTPASI